jgi:hypothetical protein
MPVRSMLGLLAALSCAVVSSPVGAQTVYKCGYRSYSELPCSKRTVSTNEAPVPARDANARRIEQNRILAQSLRRKPDETVAQFDTRRRRTRMLQEDSAECARLEKRIPVEKARMDHPDEEVIDDAQAALAQSRKRYAAMRC